MPRSGFIRPMGPVDNMPPPPVSQIMRLAARRQSRITTPTSFDTIVLERSNDEIIPEDFDYRMLDEDEDEESEHIVTNFRRQSAGVEDSVDSHGTASTAEPVSDSELSEFTSYSEIKSVEFKSVVLDERTEIFSSAEARKCGDSKTAMAEHTASCRAIAMSCEMPTAASITRSSKRLWL